MRSKLLACSLMLFASGCAALHEENRYIARALDEHLSPPNVAAKIALSPVAIPVGLAALAIDSVIIQPVVEAPEAFDDAYSMIFTDIPSTGFGEIIVFPARVVTFPVVFIVRELVGCVFGSLNHAVT